MVEARHATDGYTTVLAAGSSRAWTAPPTWAGNLHAPNTPC